MKKTISVILSVVIMLSVLTISPITASALTQNDVVSWMESKNGTTIYDGGTQCVAAFNSYLRIWGISNPISKYPVNYAYQIFNYNAPDGWQKISGNGNYQVGDVVIWGSSIGGGCGHVGMVYSTSGGTVKIFDQNYVAKNVCGIHNIAQTSAIRGVFRPPLNSGNNPTGCLDGLVGGTGTVKVSGWAFDRDDMTASLNIHVYIGGQAGDSNAEGYGYIIANEGRGDVNAAYGCGDYHGFSSTIFTSKTGTQPVYVYAINVGGGENVCIGSGTVNITADTEKPNIESAYLSRVTADSYRVCVIPKDNVGIKVVRVATWTQSDQSDLIWHDCNFNGYETYFIDINRSDYFSGATVYQNHIYVYDLAGNSVGIPKEMVYETNPPQISNITISQVSKSGFRINCKVSDDTGISSIKFPTWTSYNGQDDIIWYDGIVKNGTATCYVKANEHNNETGPYTIHIYLYDTYGNLSTAIINGIELKDEPTEVSSVEYKGKIYKVFNSGFGWSNAKLWCESQGGHLATINSEEEWEIVKKALNDFNGAKCWLGAENKSGSWKWVTGEELSFTKWAQNQPDCCGNNEFYLGTFGNDSLESLNCYLWNDYAESGVEVGGFVCEFEYTCGDVNNDGSINITDTTAIQKHIASINTLDENALIRADVNSDSSVDIKDATLIQQYCAGLIDKF